jgi:2-polyprenyl-3-methyl-5-hydroxy-6-metoxy-1,4-benzoquinol methylase
VGSGHYQRITETVADIHELVIERFEPRPGNRWLDLACGTGAVAERAAARGAQVTGVDLAPARPSQVCGTSQTSAGIKPQWG